MYIYIYIYIHRHYIYIYIYIYIYNKGSAVGVASTLATVVYVAMVMPILYDHITQISNMKVIGFMVELSNFDT